MTRNPAKSPQPGDVLVIVEFSEMHGRDIEHHLGVTDRRLRSVRVLDGNFYDGRGSMGGSPNPLRLDAWRRLAATGEIRVRAEEGLHGWDAVTASWFRGPVVQPAPMAAPKNPRGGRPKRVPGEPTKAYAFNITAGERARYEALAAKWGCDLSDAIRRAVDEACEREGVSR